MLTGAILDLYDWRWAFIVPGVISIAIGIAYMIYVRAVELETMYPSDGLAAKASNMSIDRDMMIRVFLINFFTTALGGLIFQNTTYTLPEIFMTLAGCAALIFVAVLQLPKIAAITGVSTAAAE